MIGFLPGLLGTQTEQGDKDKKLLEKAKLELFDRNWDAALKKLDHLIKAFPDSSHYPLALFYKGRCLEEQKKSKTALAVYTEYLKISSNNLDMIGRPHGPTLDQVFPLSVTRRSKKT